MEARTARSSAAIVQQVPPEAADRFRRWQNDVAAAAQTFAGYEGTDLYPPASNETNEWVTVIHFANEQSLQHWIDSPLRAQWVEKLRATVGDFELKTLNGGFSLWFDGLKQGAAGQLPPAWKMALTVLCGLYPTVMLLTVFVAPITSPLGFSVSMLIGNALSVALLQWIVVPALLRVLQPWLDANSNKAQWLSIAGAGAIVMLLLLIAVLFRAITG